MSGPRTPAPAAPAREGDRPRVEAPDEVRAFVEGDEKSGKLLDGAAYVKWLQDGGDDPCPDSSV